MTSSCVQVELIQKDAEKMITATKKELTMKVIHAQDTAHLIALMKNSDAPSQTIQSPVALFLLYAFQKKRTTTVKIVTINNAHFFAILKANNCVLDLKTIWDARLQINASLTALKHVQFNALMMKSNAKVNLTAKLTV